LLSVEPRMRDLVWSVVHEADRAASLGALRGVLLDAMPQLECRHVVCGAHVEHANPPPQAFCLHNLPDAWIRHAARHSYHRLNPIHRYAERTWRTFSWEDPDFLARLNARQIRFMNDARRMRLGHGFTIPLSHALYLPASCSFVCDEDEFSPSLLVVARQIARAIYLRGVELSRVPPPSMRAVILLTSQERRCLALKAEGHSDVEIADKLKIGASTVGSHLDQAKLRLGARSREHAVFLAIKTRQIE